MQIKDSTILLTGASAGIGLAAAKRLVEQGARLAIAARSADKLNALAEALDGDVMAIPTDMANREEVKRMVDSAASHFGRLDAIINNAAVSAACPVEKTPDDIYKYMLDVNLFGPLHAMQAAIPIMRAQGGGLVVNISSMVSRVIWPSMGAYASTKYALNCLSETLRVETADDNIRVSVVFPDNTGTDFGKNALMMVDPPTEVPGGGDWVVDTPEQVAETILTAIRDEPVEIYVRGNP